MRGRELFRLGPIQDLAREVHDMPRHHDLRLHRRWMNSQILETT